MTVPHVDVENPAFDVTPAAYISAIITEKGIGRSPYGKSLKDLFEKDKREERRRT